MFVVEKVKSLPAMPISHTDSGWCLHCSTSHPSSCWCSWESSGGKAKCLGLCAHVEDLWEPPSSCHGLAQLQLQQSFQKWTSEGKVSVSSSLFKSAFHLCHRQRFSSLYDQHQCLLHFWPSFLLVYLEKHGIMASSCLSGRPKWDFWFLALARPGFGCTLPLKQTNK